MRNIFGRHPQNAGIERLRMQINPLTLSFEGELEAQFQEDYYHSSLPLLRMSFLLGAVYYAIFAFLDALVLPEARVALAMVRFLFVCPIILTIFSLSYTKNFRAWWQTGAVIATMASGLGIVIMTSITSDLGKQHYYPGIMLILFYCYMLIRLRFIYATLAGWLIFIAYVISIRVFHGPGTNVTIINLFFISSANILGMFGGYALEYYARKDFYNRHLLDLEREKVYEANVNLEQKVIEKTEQLQQSQKMESVGRLAGGVAHDFNNLLTAIQGFSELIKYSLKEDDPIQNDVKGIQKAADSAASLTSQLLAFSRRQIASPKIINLNDSISKSEKMLRRIIGEDIDFDFHPDAETSSVFIDAGQIDQILVNLAVNSKDAMPEGGKMTLKTATVMLHEETCQTCKDPISGRFVLLTVSDNGQGMDEQTLSNVFEPFFTTKEKGKGTGLGLSTIHGIVHQNEGHIKVRSEPGVGTKFKVYLPLAEDKEDQSASEDEPVGLHGHETVLVAEDQEMVRQLAIRTLKSKGYDTLEARDGGEALMIFEEKSEAIDLLLTDVIMPHVNGKTLYDRLSRSRPDLKVIFMSGYTDDAIAHHGVLERGINFIQKPFRPDELAKKVRQVLDGPSGPMTS